MHATLGLEMSVRILAGHQQSDGFDAYFFALLNVDSLRFETASLDPALVHSQQHIGPIARLGAACARVNCNKRIRAIVFARKKLAQLEFIELMSQAVLFGGDFLLRLSTSSGIAFFRSQLM